MATKKQKWISKKIAKLIGEGKEQEQASAIAYSMYEEKKKDIESELDMLSEEEEEMSEEMMTEEQKKKMMEEDEDNKDACKPKKVDSVDHIDFSDAELSTRLDETPEGYLVGRAIVTNVGVFTYLNSDGTTRKELRLPEEVFNPDSLASFVGKPITNDHPTNADGMVTKRNYQDLAVGTMMSPINHDEYHVSAGIVINKQDGVAAVKMGKQALSVGYSCNLDWTPGTWMGMTYDCVQRNIRANHLSIVDRGRAGDSARLRLDYADAAVMVASNRDVKEDTMAEKNLRTINLDNVEYTAEDAVILAYQGERTRADGLQAKLDATSSEKSTVEAERDALKERVDSLDKELAAMKAKNEDNAEIEAKVQARLALMAIAEKAGVKLDNADEKAIKLAIIKAVSPSANLDGKDDQYIAARFDLAVETLNEKKNDEAAQAVRSMNADTAGTAEKPSVEARKRMLERYGKRA